MKIEQLYKLYTKSYVVDTDTRKIREGSLFFALKGKNFNGNKFAVEALKNGAKYAIVDENSNTVNPNIIKVENSLQTLQKLANYHRKKLNITLDFTVKKWYFLAIW